MLAIFLLLILPTLPNDRTTPGIVAEHDVDKVCVSGYSSTVRKTTDKAKRRAYSNYGLTGASCGRCEVDHRVPLLLGGADVLDNLWPQSYDLPFGAQDKDALEIKVHAAVCHDHSISLKEGQQIFLGNWVVAFRRWFPQDLPAPVFAQIK